MVYKTVYKNVASCLGICTACLRGNYANVGIMQLYGDDSSKKLKQAAVEVRTKGGAAAVACHLCRHGVPQLFAALPTKALAEYPKLGAFAYAGISSVARSDAFFMFHFPPATFKRCIDTCLSGIRGTGSSMTGVMACVDTVVPMSPAFLIGSLDLPWCVLLLLRR